VEVCIKFHKGSEACRRFGHVQFVLESMFHPVRKS
jgi:hypothetical protein